MAGLFDPTPLTVQQLNGQNPTVFSWKNADGQTRIAAANPLVSQRSVVDNTWHHVAFVANAKGQALYLDGMLQGTSQPLNHDTLHLDLDHVRHDPHRPADRDAEGRRPDPRVDLGGRIPGLHLRGLGGGPASLAQPDDDVQRR